MNDNRDDSRGVEIHLPAYFLIDRGLFDFYSFLPDFIAVEASDHRLTSREQRRLSVQIRDPELFLRVTEYRFYRV
jgi:hypothetical protein